MRAPIFIIGYPRSGTSFVGKLVAQFTGYPSHGESHTLTLLQELHHQINLYGRRADFTGKELVKQLDLNMLKSRNTTFFRDFYLQTYGSACFIDKTPGAVACHGWGVVKQVFPESCFVGCVRSPVEIYESALQKFGNRQGTHGEIDPIKLAEGWVGAMQGIEELGQSDFSADLHVVSQLELRTDPASSVAKLFRFLGISNEKVAEAVKLCKKSRDDVLTASINSSSYKLLQELEIEAAIADRFKEVCKTACSRWGIGL